MATFKRTMQNINDNTRHAAEYAGQMSQQMGQQTQVLKGIQFTSAISAAANIATAANTARQVQLQQESLSIQKAMAAQDSAHNFAMWRQTPDGAAFVEWQQRAASLVKFLKLRDQMWMDAWRNCIAQAQAQTPPEEIQRLSNKSRTPSHSGLTLAWIAAIIVSVFTAFEAINKGVLLVRVIIAAIGGMPLDASIIGIIASCILPLVFFAAALVATIYLGRRRKKASALEQVDMVQNDALFIDEQRARIAKWGFDPLTVNPSFIGFGWTYFGRLIEYMNQVEDVVINGQTTFPAPSQLPRLIIPDAIPPNPAYQQPINDTLNAFARQAEALIEG